METISLNQKWKNSGTTLSYKEWRQREDAKMLSADGEKPVITFGNAKLLDALEKEDAIQQARARKRFLGIPSTVFYLGGVLILGAIAYKIYKSRKK